MQALTVGHGKTLWLVSLTMAGVVGAWLGAMVVDDDDSEHHDSEHPQSDIEMGDVVGRGVALSGEGVK